MQWRRRGKHRGKVFSVDSRGQKELRIRRIQRHRRKVPALVQTNVEAVAEPLQSDGSAVVSSTTEA